MSQRLPGRILVYLGLLITYSRGPTFTHYVILFRIDRIQLLINVSYNPREPDAVYCSSTCSTVLLQQTALKNCISI